MILAGCYLAIALLLMCIEATVERKFMPEDEWTPVPGIILGCLIWPLGLVIVLWRVWKGEL